MKALATLLSAIGLLACTSSCTYLDTSTFAPPQTATQRAVAALPTSNARANRQADYYIYLQSASWCSYCRTEMPEIVKQYRKMKASGRVELILISADKTEQAAKSFARNYGGTFPVTMMFGSKVSRLVGYTQARSIPYAIIVDKNGRVIKKGSASIIKQWERYCPTVN